MSKSIRNRELISWAEQLSTNQVHTSTSPHCTAGVDHRALRELSAVCSFLIFRLNAYDCNPTHGTQSYRETSLVLKYCVRQCNSRRMWGPKKLGAGGHSNGHHASRDERITKSSEQSVEHSMIRNRREKYLVFESPRRAPVHTRTSPHCTAGVDHRALRELSAVCSLLIFRLNAHNCNPTHGTQSYRETSLVPKYCVI